MTVTLFDQGVNDSLKDGSICFECGDNDPKLTYLAATTCTWSIFASFLSLSIMLDPELLATIESGILHILLLFSIFELDFWRFSNFINIYFWGFTEFKVLLMVFLFNLKFKWNSIKFINNIRFWYTQSFWKR